MRGLRWTDIDLKGNTLTVRRALTRGEETTPKSGDQRVVPIAAPLRALLEAAEPSRSNPWPPSPSRRSVGPGVRAGSTRPSSAPSNVLAARGYASTTSATSS